MPKKKKIPSESLDGSAGIPSESLDGSAGIPSESPDDSAGIPSETPEALAARALAEVEARAAAAHARELAEAEAAAREGSEESAPEGDSPAGIAARISGPRAAMTWDEDEDDEDDEEAYDDRWDDATYAHHRGPRRPLRDRARGRSGVVELLMFRIGTERFAVELSSVEEAIDLPDVHHVPEMPPAMVGVITVRGALTPVFTPDDALGVRVERRSAALIFRSLRGRFALAIDDADDVMTLDLSQLRDAPGVDGSDPVVLGVARNEGSIVALVDAEALIEACQAIPVPELA
jgi:chemotaxis signal transduction protein